MAVAHDAVVESHTGTTGSANETSFSWTHVPVSTPRGLLVFVVVAGGDLVSGVTYGGIAMDEVPGAAAADTGGEPQYVETYFLGADIPAGNQTVIVTRTNTAQQIWAVSISVTADSDTAIHEAGIETAAQNQALTEVSVDDGSPGANSMRYAALGWGGTNPPAVGANTTTLLSILYGAQSATVARETTAGQGSRPVGWNTSGGSDDVAAVYLAVIETAVPAPTWVPQMIFI